jgi:hypothetical protein
MAIKTCERGHTFDKTSDCSVCPTCSAADMKEKFGAEFPKIGAPAFCALDHLGVSRLSQLTKFSEKELLAQHGFGPKALKLLREKLTKTGKTFAKKV